MQLFDNIKIWAKNSIVDDIIIFALIIAIIENIAQNTIKLNEENSFKFFIGIFLYVFIGYLLNYTYNNYSFGVLNIIWSSISIILAILIGYMFYNEPINRWKILGLISAIMAIYFMYRADDKNIT
jgi:multidrug transporter EmrE-like cation transporter